MLKMTDNIPDVSGSQASSISCGVLKLTQGLGDRQALLNKGRRVIRFHLDKDAQTGLKQLVVQFACT
jgi:hypothetical protein